MGENDTSGTESPGPQPDLQYDLAHEIGESGGERPRGDHVHVATETNEYDGDYGYDLAHEVRASDVPRRPR